ncbi:hypothetical protein [Pararhizobium sp. PWRC1-1]|uniref:hypothetical protein n=1 Tax=Pararhizobium sp. PWRC1-1 TaxID=2804566 RepID=UPI003CE87286
MTLLDISIATAIDHKKSAISRIERAETARNKQAYRGRTPRRQSHFYGKYFGGFVKRGVDVRENINNGFGCGGHDPRPYSRSPV